ncbi:flagellar biosynthesis protein FliR [Sesbania bispinosa]|nr:flagellar biosynthesis protein FliR [Sesbania bispinosa]
MALFYAFLPCQPFCPANLPAMWSVDHPAFQFGMSFSLLAPGLLASLLHQRATCFTPARRQECLPGMKARRLPGKES